MSGALLGLAVLLQTLELLLLPRRSGQGRHWLWIRLGGLVLCAALSPTWWSVLILLISSYALNLHWRGSFNGGSDTMTLHLLLAWWTSVTWPHLEPKATLYVMALTITSYLVAGLAKARVAGWWNGQALREILLESQSVHQGRLTRALTVSSTRTRLASWTVLAFELSFPVTLFVPELRVPYLIAGVAFHLGNYLIFGLNRFFWIWLTAYSAFL